MSLELVLFVLAAAVLIWLFAMYQRGRVPGRSFWRSVQVGRAWNMRPRLEKLDLPEEEMAEHSARIDARISSLTNKMKEQEEKNRDMVLSAFNSLQGDTITISGQPLPVAGTHAEVDGGAQKNRVTVTRVGTGAVLAGGTGAIIGGLAKKDQTKIYITISHPTGVILVKPFKRDREHHVRTYAAKVNAASQYWATRTPLDTDDQIV